MFAFCLNTFEEYNGRDIIAFIHHSFSGNFDTRFACGTMAEVHLENKKALQKTDVLPDKFDNLLMTIKYYLLNNNNN